MILKLVLCCTRTVLLNGIAIHIFGRNLPQFDVCRAFWNNSNFLGWFLAKGEWWTSLTNNKRTNVLFYTTYLQSYLFCRLSKISSASIVMWTFSALVFPFYFCPFSPYGQWVNLKLGNSKDSSYLSSNTTLFLKSSRQSKTVC